MYKFQRHLFLLGTDIYHLQRFLDQQFTEMILFFRLFSYRIPIKCHLKEKASKNGELSSRLYCILLDQVFH